MASIVPSYMQKISRAKEHLDDLKSAVEKYRATRPYQAFQDIESKQKAWRLHFTASPENTRIPIIAADLVYNLRSGLDHLAAALVPISQRSHVMFPIFWEGVWEPLIPGENGERRKARERWNTCTRHMSADAVEILKSLQPRTNVLRSDREIYQLDMLNKLSNINRHRHFPVIAPGLLDVTAKIKTEVGMTGWIEMPETVYQILNDHAKIYTPEPAVHMQLEGTPYILIRVKSPKGQIIIPDSFERGIHWLEDRILNPLIPHIYVTPSEQGRSQTWA
jgi:hypothetical protein